MTGNKKLEEDGAYSGRWVARLRGRVVAQGGTPEQARRASLSRFKESAEISYMPFKGSLKFPQIFEDLLRLLPDDQPVYLVGGGVRDLLLGRELRDLDFALQVGGIRLARKISKLLDAEFYILDQERDTGRIIITAMDGGRILLDFASFRGPDLEADLYGRDFTLNSIALDVKTRTIYDPLGGVQDLDAKVLRSCSPSAFIDDPVRILRGIRLAAQYDFRIHSATRQSMQAAARLIEKVSPERVRDELFRILEGPRPADCLKALEMIGVLEFILPEVASRRRVNLSYHHDRIDWEHTLARIDSLEAIISLFSAQSSPELDIDPENQLLTQRLGRYRPQITSHYSECLVDHRTIRGLVFLSALFTESFLQKSHPLSPEAQAYPIKDTDERTTLATAWGKELVLSNAEITWVEEISFNRMRLLPFVDKFQKEGSLPSRKEIYHFFRDARSVGVDLCLLALADLRTNSKPKNTPPPWSAGVEVIDCLLENLYLKPGETISPSPLVNGTALMKELNIKAGPKIGELLEYIREGQATGMISTREQALEMARSKLTGSA